VQILDNQPLLVGGGGAATVFFLPGPEPTVGGPARNVDDQNVKGQLFLDISTAEEEEVALTRNFGIRLPISVALYLRTEFSESHALPYFFIGGEKLTLRLYIICLILKTI
jgi:hypothetical protein